MRVRDQLGPPPPQSLGSVLRAVVSHRGVQTAVAVWVIGHVVVLWLARGSLPFDRPAVAHLLFASQIAEPTVVLIEIFVLMVLAFLLTRNRVIPDLAARAPERGVAWRETILVLVYAGLGQVGGWILAPALGYRAFSFHVAGTVFGHTMTPTPTEVWIWAFYNLLVFAVAPYVYFRRRYTSTALNLHSTDRRNDIRLIIIVLAHERRAHAGDNAISEAEVGERFLERAGISSCCLTRTDSATTAQAPLGPPSRRSPTRIRD